MNYYRNGKIIFQINGLIMFSLRSIDGVILSQGVTIPRAIYQLNKALKGKVSVFRNDVYFCDYYI